MRSLIVAITIDKIQNFLYHAIRAHEQEKQKEEDTLKTICNSSREISQLFMEAVQKKFYIEGKHENQSKILLSIPGKVIFKTVLLKEIVIQKLNELYRDYYHLFAGQVELKYVIIEDSFDKLANIRTCKQKLEDPKSRNSIIEANKEILFRFPEATYIPKSCIKIGFHKEEAKEASTVNEYIFAKNIDDLLPDVYQENQQDGRKNEQYRIAVIKADLDGVGDLFKRIDNASSYDKLSQILSDFISLDKLHHYYEKMKVKNFKMFPFYVAGDDIFFAVNVNHIFTAVNLLKTMLNEMNIKIEQEIDSDKKLSMSVGIDISYNKQPIRYYYERVENQLNIAKKNKEPGIIKVGICINNTFFASYEEFKGKGSKIGWSKLYNEVKLLNYIRLKGCDSLGTPSYFHKLLDRITDTTIKGNNIAYINSVLYHLTPEYIGDRQKSKPELVLKKLLIDFLLTNVSSNSRPSLEITLNENTKYWFEKKLRLLMFFSDERFKATFNEELTEIEFNNDYWKLLKIKSLVYTKPLRYLYDHIINRNPYGKLFIERKKHSGRIEIYCKVKLTSSMLFKLKKYKNLQSIERTVAILKHTKLREDQKTDSKEKPVYYKDFNSTVFEKKASDNSEQKYWDEDFIDSLINFYNYDNALIAFKNIYKDAFEKEKDKDNKRTGNKNHQQKNKKGGVIK
ncbi:hypothetical protein BHU72_05900 [Desulfuribacillus stibiiarsenatis]|uniref:Cas10/Cmr2 second palm domain-containing protein n=1 Tax=Desulfuribacillus stibiiarsenatis TaxID=1390249 RepID=A0A1E5L556_9FIRM|nr:hypothetical protein [Desulfuribacillus stibiiarsenatis]OEH85143.1 hypothetical protein BHU72_05900 [Desulfuribacillus stibiiarsenatis]